MWIDKFDRIYIIDYDFNLLKFEIGEEQPKEEQYKLLSRVSLTKFREHEQLRSLRLRDKDFNRISVDDRSL